VEAGPLSEVRRVWANIDGYVPDVACEYANEFSLGFSELVVEPPQHAPNRIRLIVLNKLGGKTGRGKGRLVEYLCEPTATISKAAGLNKFDVPERAADDLHPRSLFAERKWEKRPRFSLWDE